MVKVQCMAGGMHVGEGAWWGGCMAGGAWQGGMCGRGRGMHGGGGCAWWWGVCMVVGACMVGDIHGKGTWACVARGMFGRVGVCAGKTGAEAGGMHPTGMHSCCHFDLSFKSFPYVSYYMENVSLSIV